MKTGKQGYVHCASFLRRPVENNRKETRLSTMRLLNLSSFAADGAQPVLPRPTVRPFTDEMNVLSARHCSAGFIAVASSVISFSSRTEPPLRDRAVRSRQRRTVESSRGDEQPRARSGDKFIGRPATKCPERDDDVRFCQC